MKVCFIIAIILSIAVSSLSAQIKHGLRDEQGRHIVPRGFVVNTNDPGGQIEFFEDDYARMVRMGANYQVIRLELGRISEFPGCQVEESYLQKLDRLVRRGREAGIDTVFKLTVYGAKGFGWERFWANEDNAQGIYLDAWRVIWERYKDHVSVVGYDLVNEPRKLTMDISYDDLTNDYLIPYYERLIDAGMEYSDSKLYLCQTIFMNKGEAINHNQYAEIKKPINRPNVVFAPHIYQERLPLIEPTMQRFGRESEMLDAPILIGEWGFPTYRSADSSVSEQLEYIAHYTKTAEIFDQMGVGSIKAWFLGTRKYNDFLPGGESTWSIFVDPNAAGTVERKYITDIISRPYPQAIAGDIMSFMFHHATRTLEVAVNTDNSKGASKIFVAADRHYPDGFTVRLGEGLVLTKSPLDNGRIRVLKSSKHSDPADFVWSEATQQLIVLRWPEDGVETTLKVVPGIAVLEN